MHDGPVNLANDGASMCGDEFGAEDLVGRSGSTRALLAPSGELQAPRWADDALAACRANSFVPGTLVLMADGTTTPIEDIGIGDWVWATDPETGEAGPRRVTDTIVGDGIKDLVDIEIDGATITATDGHPFWVDDRGRWIDADDLQPGDLLVLADGTAVAVDAVAARTGVLTVHNLTVDGIHTYHVMAGDDPVLVHNCARLSPNQMNQAIRRGQAPRGITRIDVPKVPGEQLHATFPGGAALNVDGTWKHGFVEFTRAQRNWLLENGWSL